ncbi:hypothetical protein L1887_49675 [Cichorium endivia]|nr:hypothetical protein L1887_49675 [Cichorium endivia]
MIARGGGGGARGDADLQGPPQFRCGVCAILCPLSGGGGGVECIVRDWAGGLRSQMGELGGGWREKGDVQFVCNVPSCGALLVQLWMGGWSSLVRIYKLGRFLATQTSSTIIHQEHTQDAHFWNQDYHNGLHPRREFWRARRLSLSEVLRGLGFAAASALIEEGAHVVIGSSSSDKVSAAVAKLGDPSLQFNADPSRVSGYTVNLSGGAAEASLREFFGKIGAFDHLIHTAGDTLRMKPLGEWDYKSLVEAGDVRYFSAILAVKIATEDPNLLRRNSGGSIVLTTGGGGLKNPCRIGALLPDTQLHSTASPVV